MAEQLIIPPIRVPLTGTLDNNAGNNAKPVAARDYWLFWQRLAEAGNLAAQNIAALQSDIDGLDQDITDLTQVLNDTLRFGTHAARLAAVADPSGALWVETDRNNIVYQVQMVGGAPAWVYVTGAMYGTIIAADQRPTDLGANDTGLIFLSSDSTSVRWMGTSWAALDRILDLGPAPSVSQLVAKANGTGALSVLTYAANNVNLGFDVEFSGSGWVARDATCFVLNKTGGLLHISRSFGNTVGGSAALTDALTLDLANGRWTIGAPSVGPALLVNGTGGVSSPVQRWNVFGTGVAVVLRAGPEAFPDFGTETAHSLYFITGGTRRMMIGSDGSIAFFNLQATLPPAGSKQIWYDPADGNRVKFAP